MRILIVQCLLIVICISQLKAANNDNYIKENKLYKIDSLNTIARKEWKAERFEHAVEYLLNVLEMQQEMENKTGIIKTCQKIGYLHLHNSQYSAAYSYFNNAYEISKEKKLKKTTLLIQLNLAYITMQMDEMDKSLIYLNDILANVFETGDTSLIKRTYGITALYYEKTGDMSNALNYYTNYETISYQILEKRRASFWRNNLKDIILDTETNLLDSKIKFALHNLQLKEKDNRIIQVQKVKNILVSGIVINVLVLIVLIYLLIDRIKDNKKLNRQKREIEQQKEELSTQKEELSNQNKHITSSINYAQTIQSASLPDSKQIAKHLDCGIMYRPKDIVSGDFYWYQEIDEKQCLLAVVDSTGHGVPGAFMSLIGIQLLNEIVIAKNILEPAEILDHLNKKLHKALKQNISDNDDGMDVCLCKLENIGENGFNVVFSGAKRPLFHYSSEENKINIIHGNSSSTGGRYAKKENVTYNQEIINVKHGDLLLLTTDGIVDQPSANNKKYGSNHLLEIIAQNAKLPVSDQIKLLSENFDNHIGSELQRDDITVIIVKI